MLDKDKEYRILDFLKIVKNIDFFESSLSFTSGFLKKSHLVNYFQIFSKPHRQFEVKKQDVTFFTHFLVFFILHLLYAKIYKTH